MLRKQIKDAACAAASKPATQGQQQRKRKPYWRPRGGSRIGGEGARRPPHSTEEELPSAHASKSSSPSALSALGGAGEGAAVVLGLGHEPREGAPKATAMLLRLELEVLCGSIETPPPPSAIDGQPIGPVRPRISGERPIAPPADSSALVAAKGSMTSP